MRVCTKIAVDSYFSLPPCCLPRSLRFLWSPGDQVRKGRQTRGHVLSPGIDVRFSWSSASDSHGQREHITVSAILAVVGTRGRGAADVFSLNGTPAYFGGTGHLREFVLVLYTVGLALL